MTEFKPKQSIDTLCATAGRDAPTSTSLVPPIYQASVFPIETLEETDDLFDGMEPGYFYSRDGNPTTDALAQAVARLEGAEDGIACASGMGATLTALLSATEPGKRIVASRDLYGKSATLLQTLFAPLGADISFVDSGDTSAWESALATPARVVFLETITNPLLRVPDLPAISTMAKEAGATVIVDNTFATPYHLRPLELGADLVVHSATKYLGGHNDVTAGVVVGDADRLLAARAHASTMGVNLSPFEAWLTLRGLKTLALRMSRSSANALEVARHLDSHAKVAATHYPGLAKHPDHAVAKHLLENGSGAMVSFEVVNGAEGASRLFRNLGFIKYAPSLGDVGTTVSHPAKTSHRGIGPIERRAQGISDGLVRLSVGIESSDDVIAELDRALEAV